MSWFSALQALITFRKNGSADFIVPELDAQGRIRVVIENSTSGASILLQNFIDEGPAEGYTTGAYKEVLPAGSPFPTSEIWWTSTSKTAKIVELNITRDGSGIPLVEQWKMYNTSNILVTTVTDTYTYVNGIFESSRVRTIT